MWTAVVVLIVGISLAGEVIVVVIVVGAVHGESEHCRKGDNCSEQDGPENSYLLHVHSFWRDAEPPLSIVRTSASTRMLSLYLYSHGYTWIS